MEDQKPITPGTPSNMDLKLRGGGRRRRRRRTLCLVFIAFILLLGLVFLILGLTVFKAKRPVTSVDSLSLTDLQVGFDIARPRVFVNLTVQADVSVKNPNKVGFRFQNSSMLLNYRGDVIGDALIPAGRIGSGETVPMNISVTVMAERLIANSNFYSDAISGTLHLSTFLRIKGKVRLLFTLHVVSYTTCDMYIDVSSRSLRNQTCRYKTKL